MLQDHPNLCLHDPSSNMIAMISKSRLSLEYNAFSSQLGHEALWMPSDMILKQFRKIGNK